MDANLRNQRRNMGAEEATYPSVPRTLRFSEYQTKSHLGRAASPFAAFSLPRSEGVVRSRRPASTESTRLPDCVKTLFGTVGAALCRDIRSERDSSRHKAAPTASGVDPIRVFTQPVTLAATNPRSYAFQKPTVSICTLKPKLLSRRRPEYRLTRYETSQVLPMF